MNIKLWLDDNTPLPGCPTAQFPGIPRKGEIIYLKGGTKHEVVEVQWNVADGESALIHVTVSK